MSIKILIKKKMKIRIFLIKYFQKIIQIFKKIQIYKHF